MDLLALASLEPFEAAVAAGRSVLADGYGRVNTFGYENYRHDPRPRVLVLGHYTHPSTGNRLLGGINLNYLNDSQVEELRAVLPQILKTRNLRDRYWRGRELLPDIFTNFYRDYNEDYIDVVTPDTLRFKKPAATPAPKPAATPTTKPEPAAPQPEPAQAAAKPEVQPPAPVPGLEPAPSAPADAPRLGEPEDEPNLVDRYRELLAARLAKAAEKTDEPAADELAADRARAAQAARRRNTQPAPPATRPTEPPEQAEPPQEEPAEAEMSLDDFAPRQDGDAMHKLSTLARGTGVDDPGPLDAGPGPIPGATDRRRSRPGP